MSRMSQMSKSVTIPKANPAQVVRKILMDPDTFATTLLVWAIDCFGMECLEWHPGTIKMELEQRYNCQIPKVNLDKLMAAVMILTTDLFFKDEARFIELANILSGDDFQPDEFDPADSVECAWAVTEALLLCPPDDDDPEPFSDNVRRYIGFVLKEEGYITPPDVLKIAIGGDFSEQVRYTFSDDPEMFSAVYQGNTDKTAEVEAIIKDSLRELVMQLQALPLTSGNTAELVQRLSQNIQTAAAVSDENNEGGPL